jgi:regulator of protease activity HflC (stomatin/prohibitin superfamily)
LISSSPSTTTTVAAAARAEAAEAAEAAEGAEAADDADDAAEATPTPNAGLSSDTKPVLLPDTSGLHKALLDTEILSDSSLEYSPSCVHQAGTAARHFSLT